MYGFVYHNEVALVEENFAQLPYWCVRITHRSGVVKLFSGKDSINHIFPEMGCMDHIEVYAVECVYVAVEEEFTRKILDMKEGAKAACWSIRFDMHHACITEIERSVEMVFLEFSGTYEIYRHAALEVAGVRFLLRVDRKEKSVVYPCKDERDILTKVVYEQKYKSVVQFVLYACEKISFQVLQTLRDKIYKVSGGVLTHGLRCAVYEHDVYTVVEQNVKEFSLTYVE